MHITKYLKWAVREQWSMLPMLINYKDIPNTLTYLKITLPMNVPIHITNSPTYPTAETADMQHY